MRFSPAEAEFLRAQRVGRLATVSPRGWPHVVPVAYQLLDDGAFEFDADGAKLRNLTAEPRAALVVDAMGPKRGVSLQGTTRVIGPERVRLDPEHHTSWGL
jgi:pyridoxamine 5'-phosphate oxidase family protein